MDCLEGTTGRRARIYWAWRREKMERVEGIEPSPIAWEAIVVPFNYTRITSQLCSQPRVSNKNPQLKLGKLSFYH